MALLLNAGDTVSRSYSYTQPSPLHPSQPQGTGERTGNLAKYWKAAYVAASGAVNANRVNGVSFPVKLEAGQTVSFTNQKTNFGRGVAIFSEFDGETLTNMIYRSTNYTVTYTADSDCYVVIWGNYDNTTSMDETVFNLCGQMLNLGSTALPYEPYGYKIPISSANTTTPVYLGEVQTTRKIRKVVFDGLENWGKDANKDNIDDYFYTDIIFEMSPSITPISSHFVSGKRDVVDSVWATGTTANPRVVLEISKSYTGITSADDKNARLAKFKAYLATQYAAGTPVTVWYVLAEPETGIVNEPLMKIGDYADTVSDISIPTIAGANTLSVDTTLQPSEVSVTYHGWHEGTVHERESGAWD